MKRHTLARASLLFLFPAALHADPLADENARLRQQVQELQTRNAALERACPAAAQVQQTAVPPATAAGAATATAAPVVAPAPPAPAAPTVHQPLQLFASKAAPAPTPDSAAAPPPPTTPPDYANTGCDRGFFSGPAGGKWQDSKAWKALHPGMGQSEVEALLGIEHYNEGEPKSGALHWQYGRCNSTYEGEVVFINGRVSSYSAP